MTEDILYRFKATVGEVYDGDTLKNVTVDVGFGMTKHLKRVRVFGVDTPELRGYASPFEFDQAMKAKALTRDFIDAAGEDLRIRTIKDGDETDNFGRYLAIVTNARTGADLASALIMADLAVYSLDGKAKWRDTYGEGGAQ